MRTLLLLVPILALLAGCSVHRHEYPRGGERHSGHHRYERRHARHDDGHYRHHDHHRGHHRDHHDDYRGH